MASLDTKMTFTLKDIIFLITFSASVIGIYVDLTSDVDQLKEQVASLKEANKAYVGLPKDVETMKKDMKKYGALTETIYYGLLSEGIIKPPQ